MDTMDNTKTIFISHANPTDNQFALWLSIRLMSIGYDIWCDVLKLSKGGDFWCEIEEQIRTKTCKFLLVQSRASNHSEGVMKEIAVAQKVKKARNDPNFIVPLIIDSELSFDDINVEVIRLNSINFTSSWATGFADLQKALNEQNCPRQRDDNKFSFIVERLNHKYCPIEQDEEYASNWFEILNIPGYLNFFPSKDLAELPQQPVLTYKHHIVTFWTYNNLPDAIRRVIINSPNYYHLKASEYLSNDSKLDFIKSSTYRKLYIGVLSKVFDHSIRNYPGIRCRVKNDRSLFWYPQGVLKNDRVERIFLVGKHKKFKWHFAISGTIKLYPTPLLQIRSHVLFSNNGRNLLEADSDQHKLRRSIGKRWWNKEWLTKLLAFIKTLKKETDSNIFILEKGVNEAIKVSCSPMAFVSNFAYMEPEHEAEEELDDRAAEDYQFSEIGDDEDFA